MSKINLMLGDCLERMKEIADCSVDMILTDPPYGTTMCKWDSLIDLDLMWLQLKRIIKPSGAIVLMAQTPFDKVLGCSNLEMLRHEWIWEKTNATGFLNAKKMPLKAHENALVFYKSLPVYNPQFTHGHERKTAKRKTVNSECYGKALNLTDYDSTSRYPRSVIKFQSDKQKQNLHPTQKPVALMEYLIKTYTNENETVLDFTMGSGTTGVAAKNLQRDFIGIEMDKGYFNVAKERINKHGC
ncbi:MAG: site-specific DNA-methyltransferase [Immundisolibacteraceae bacterium]|nr:site-specific DNA-methyltransferase [Immundisolibacteraceae bacterium]